MAVKQEPEGVDPPEPPEDNDKRIETCLTELEATKVSLSQLTERLSEAEKRADPKVAAMESQLSKTRAAMQRTLKRLRDLRKRQSQQKSEVDPLGRKTSQKPKEHRKTSLGLEIL
jgi:ABC-type transporter Mla subunit MlaD